MTRALTMSSKYLTYLSKYTDSAPKLALVFPVCLVPCSLVWSFYDWLYSILIDIYMHVKLDDFKATLISVQGDHGLRLLLNILDDFYPISYEYV